MSDKEYRQLIEQVLSDTTSHMISTDTAMEAAQQMNQLAIKEQAECAIAGGVAMHLYGSPRLTKDLDLIASKPLSLMPQHGLGFGGSNYVLQVGKYEVRVDWIVRNDGYQKYYNAALRDAVQLSNGLHVITPAWLVILKFIAGRQKDFDDIVFLLKQPGTVSRPAIKEKVVETAGEDAWLAMLPSLRRLFDQADGNTKERSKYYDRD
jgi:hypothetical protein